MTKTERLQELEYQERFFKSLDKLFDAGWRNWVKGIYNENDIANLRMFKILAQLKGNEFVADLIKLMGKANKHALLKLTRAPKGILLKDNRYQNIPELMINKYPSGSHRDGEVFIQIKKDRWVWFVF